MAQKNINDQDTRGQQSDRPTRAALDGQGMFGGRSIADGPPKRANTGNESAIDVPKEFMKKGFVYRWVRQSPGRLESKRAQGWEFVNDERLNQFYNPQIGQSQTKSAEKVTRTGKDGVTLYLMHVPKQWYDQWQAEKQAELDKIDNMMAVKKGDRIDSSMTGGYIEADEDSRNTPVFMEKVSNT